MMRSTMFALAAATSTMTGVATTHAALMGEWNFEEGTSATTTNGSVGSPAGNVVSDPFPTGTSIEAGGAAGSAFSLNSTGATGSFLDTNATGTDLGITGSGAKTLVAWIKSETVGAWNSGRYSVLSYSPNGGTTTGGGAAPGGDLRVVIEEGGGGFRFEVSGGFVANSTSLDDGEWHMLAVVIGASDTVKSVDLYVDGSLISKTSESSGNPTINTATNVPTGSGGLNTLIIGGDQNTVKTGNSPAGTGAFAGNIDGVRIYNSALTANEVAGLVPEPASLSLIGLAGAALMGRRRQR